VYVGGHRQLASMAGALIMARAVNDPILSGEILQGVAGSITANP
jgi:hypothetical protein